MKDKLMQTVYILWQKQMKKMMVHPESIVGMLLQPAMWVILFGAGMRSLMGSTSAGNGQDYITFMVPGITALTVVSAAIAGGSTWLIERTSGIVKEYLAAPISRLGILSGQAAGVVSKVLLQSIIILLVGVLMGAGLNRQPAGLAGGLLLIAAYGIGFSGLALAVASSTDSSEGYHMMIFLVQLPLLFLSNSLYPLAALPGWMKVGVYANPTTYVVSGLRQITMAAAPSMGAADAVPIWLCFLVSGLFAVVGMLLARRAFLKSIR